MDIHGIERRRESAVDDALRVCSIFVSFETSMANVSIQTKPPTETLSSCMSLAPLLMMVALPFRAGRLDHMTTELVSVKHGMGYRFTRRCSWFFEKKT